MGRGMREWGGGKEGWKERRGEVRQLGKPEIADFKDLWL